MGKPTGKVARIELPLIERSIGTHFEVDLFQSASLRTEIKLSLSSAGQGSSAKQPFPLKDAGLKESTAKVKWDFSLGFLHHRMLGARPKHPILQVPYT